MSTPNLPRFKVSSDAWSVLDTWNVHRVVAAHHHKSNVPLATRRRWLERRRAELEAWHAEAVRDA